MHPLLGLISVPAALTDTNTLATVQLSTLNTYLPRKSNDELLLLDGETTRLDIRLQYPAQRRWQLGFDVALYQHGGGALDGFVDQWHDTFRLPASGRESAPTGRLLYWYQRNGEDVFRLEHAASGIGDMQVWLAKSLSMLPAWSARIGLAVPSGALDQLTGKEALDVFAELNVETPKLFGSDLDAHWSVGVVKQGHSESFWNTKPEVYYSQGWFDFPLHPLWSFRGQYLIHSAAFNSSLRVLGEHALMLYGGLARKLPGWGRVTLGVSEDPEYGTAQDVGFHLGFDLAL